MTTVILKSVSLRARKKLATRARIIAAAIRMFSEQGLEAPTVEEISAAAEVGKGTIYNYFATKEEIVVAFMVDVEKQVQEKARHFSQLHGPLESILTRLVRYHLKLKEPYRNFLPVLFSQIFTRGSRLLPHLAELQKATDPPLLDFFGKLQRRGLIRTDVHLPTLTQIFKLLHFGIIIVWIHDTPPYRGTFRWLKEEMRLFCQGLARTRVPSCPG